MPASSPTLLLGNDPAALHRAVLERCLAALRSERDRGTAGTVLWITPTYRTQRQWTRTLLDAFGTACVAPPICTFESFAERLLHAAGRPATPISPTVQRVLLRRITQSLSVEDRLTHFRHVVETTGFLDVVQNFIAELKRDDVWPEDFQAACSKSRTASVRDRELGEIYGRYQQALLDHNWYDNEGRFWLARRELAEGRCRGLPRWSWIGVSGFSDFTYTQYGILELLSSLTKELAITLPQDSDNRRTSLFEKSVVAVGVLRQTWPSLRTAFISSNDEESADRRRMRELLFGNPRESIPANHVHSVEIVGCTGSDSEITSIAIRIKRWLTAGVAPGQIAVGLRSIHDDGLAWRDGLAAAGLPAWCDSGRPVTSSGLIKFLLGLLQAELEDWSFPRLTGVLGSSYLRPPKYAGDSRADARAVSQVLRRLRLAQGRLDILGNLDRAISRLSMRGPEGDHAELQDDVEDVAYTEFSVDVYRRAGQLLKWYSAATEVLRKPRHLSDWMDALSGLLNELGALQTSPIDPPDRALWERWQSLLRDAAAAEARYAGTARRLSCSEFVVELRDLLADERADPVQEPPGCIRILGLDQLRHLETPYLVVAGLTEESFPRRRGDDCLFSDAERVELVEQGLAIRHSTQHQQDELLFFYQVMLSATRQLVLSFPEVSHRGQPAFASPYVAALRTLWTDAALPVRHEGQLDPVPHPDRAVNGADLRLLATQAAVYGLPGWLRTLSEAPETRQTVNSVRAAVEMAVERFQTRGFTPYEGRLGEPTNQRLLATRFHSLRQFSATELEAYAACPFRFWLAKVLEVEPLPDVESGTDVQRRGVVVHDVLSRLIEEMQPDVAAEQLARRFSELVADKLQREPAESELQQALLRIEQQLLADWGTAYAEQFEEYTGKVRSAWGGPWRASQPEVPFGDVPNAPAAGRHPPLEFGAGDNRVFVRGRIDRIDTGTIRDQVVFTVIDYKTGRPRPFSEDDVRDGRSLQLVLYALAARRLGMVPADAALFQLGYWSLRQTGFLSGMGGRGANKFQPIDTQVWSALEQIVDETIPRLALGIRGGEFVVDNPDEDCTGRCPYRTVCRVNQIRPLADSLGKVRTSTLPTQDGTV